MNRNMKNNNGTALKNESQKNERDPFRILITTILSQRTRDENTRQASQKLFSKYHDIKSLSEANAKKVESLIQQSGFYRTKARSIISVSKILVDCYNGEVPRDFNELMALPSVGRKTANCVLVYGFHVPAIPVDIHVHRISNRLGMVNTNNPEDTEFKLRQHVERRFWIELNEEFVKFGQRICKPIKPRCVICDLKKCCIWYKDQRMK
ncbi:endonuclease III [Candidatus Bathyarchaeota archaeon]|nr:endonuclease III [Candidatus Bathyarchaeota archaeon]